MPDFLFYYVFPVQQTTQRDWSPCKVGFFGLATNTLNVRNNNDKQQQLRQSRILHARHKTLISRLDKRVQIENRVVGANVLSSTDAASQELVVGST